MIILMVRHTTVRGASSNDFVSICCGFYYLYILSSVIFLVLNSINYHKSDILSTSEIDCMLRRDISENDNAFDGGPR